MKLAPSSARRSTGSNVPSNTWSPVWLLISAIITVTVFKGAAALWWVRSQTRKPLRAPNARLTAAVIHFHVFDSDRLGKPGPRAAPSTVGGLLGDSAGMETAVKLTAEM